MKRYWSVVLSGCVTTGNNRTLGGGTFHSNDAVYYSSVSLAVVEDDVSRFDWAIQKRLDRHHVAIFYRWPHAASAHSYGDCEILGQYHAGLFQEV
jgi:hypothetical protein